MKIIKEAEYKEVQVTQRKIVSEAVYGCDECSCEIENDDLELKLTVFCHNEDRSEYLFFCSWECVFSHLPKINCDYFINLPMLHYDESKESKKSVYHLIQVFEEIKKEYVWMFKKLNVHPEHSTYDMGMYSKVIKRHTELTKL